jgi:hypothetical protein
MMLMHPVRLIHCASGFSSIDPSGMTDRAENLDVGIQGTLLVVFSVFRCDVICLLRLGIFWVGFLIFVGHTYGADYLIAPNTYIVRFISSTRAFCSHSFVHLFSWMDINRTLALFI